MICGPTGVGKSELAIQAAEHLGDTEIVSVDAYQIYRGMGILTAAPTPEQLSRIPHHLVGSVDPSRPMNAADYAQLARRAIRDIRTRGRRALVVGGNGLYLATLFGASIAPPPADPALRAQLEARPLQDLLAQLEHLDPIAAQRIDRKNPRRVVRALEVCLVTGRRFSDYRADWGKEKVPALVGTPYPSGVLILTERDLLAARILARTQAMFDQGAVAEVATLRRHIGNTAAMAIGFKEISQFLDGTLTREACIQAISKATRLYAKRQLTWFRNKTPFPIIPPTLDALLCAVLQATPHPLTTAHAFSHLPVPSDCA